MFRPKSGVTCMSITAAEIGELARVPGQGWVVTDPQVLTEMGIPQGETCVEIPDRMIPFFAEGD